MLNKELLLIGEGVKDTVTFTLYKSEGASEEDVWIAYIDYGSDTYKLEVNFGIDIEDSVTVPFIEGMDSFTLRGLYGTYSLEPNSLVVSQSGPQEFIVSGLEPNMTVVITVE